MSSKQRRGDGDKSPKEVECKMKGFARCVVAGGKFVEPFE